MDLNRCAVDLFALPSFEVVALTASAGADAIHADSDEALVILCPILGPSATLILHRLSRYAAQSPTWWTPLEFGRTFGLSSNGTSGLALRSVVRLAKFGFAVIGTGSLAVRTVVPPLPPKWLDTLPTYLRADLAAVA